MSRRGGRAAGVPLDRGSRKVCFARLGSGPFSFLGHNQLRYVFAESVEQIKVNISGGFQLHHAVGDLFALTDRHRSDRFLDA